MKYDKESLPLYIRNTSIIKELNIKENKLGFLDIYPREFKSTEILIRFCGKLYLLYIINYSNETYLRNKLDIPKISYIYSIEDMDKFINKFTNKKIQDKYYKGKLTPFYNDISNRKILEQKYLNLDIKKPAWSVDKDIIDEPILTLEYIYSLKRESGMNLFKNRNLKEIGFYKIKSPQIAYQDINSFLNNIAVKEDRIPVISDEILAESKGFNKFSFRKDSSKNR